MNRKLTRYIRRFVRHIRKTWKNKLAVLILLAIGIVSAKMTNDGTFLVFVLMAFGPIFFADENCFYQRE